MRKILIAYIFLLFEVTIPFGEGKMELLPTWIGYIFLVKGFSELQEESIIYKEKIFILEGVSITAAMIWFLEAIYPNALLIVQGPVKKLVRLFFYNITYMVVTGTEEIEEYYHVDIGAEKLKKAWWIYSLIRIINSISIDNVKIYILTTCAMFIAAIYNLFVFYKIVKLYNGLAKEKMKYRLKKCATINEE